MAYSIMLFAMTATFLISGVTALFRLRGKTGAHGGVRGAPVRGDDRRRGVDRKGTGKKK